MLPNSHSFPNPTILDFPFTPPHLQALPNQQKKPKHSHTNKAKTNPPTQIQLFRAIYAFNNFKIFFRFAHEIISRQIVGTAEGSAGKSGLAPA